jgi:transposase-like protein
MLQLAVTSVPFLQRAFDTVPLQASDWLQCILVASSVLWLRELSKVVRRSIRRSNADRRSLADENVLEILVHSRRNMAAAKKLSRQVVKGCQRRAGTRPPLLMTDKLGSYEAAKKEDLPHLEHRKH